MHIVVIHGWREEPAELVQALAAALGITAYEMRQRMIGGGPAVVASFADPQQARIVAVKLTQSGVTTLIVDSDALRSKAYDGFGAAMKLSRELNFACLKSELRRLCPAAGYDDRLLNRLGQVRLLGPAQNPENNIDLAFDILARSLRRGRITA